MKIIHLTLLSAFLIFNTSCAQNTEDKKNSLQNEQINMNNEEEVPFKLSDEEWKKRLSPDQYHVLREKGTERPNTGEFYLHKEKGVYVCAGCGEDLFTSDMKFDSHCGWPSFDKEIQGGKVIHKKDKSHGMVRTEILCAKCGSHLGHIFDDGPTETGMRYCVNSLSLDFKNNTFENDSTKK